MILNLKRIFEKYPLFSQDGLENPLVIAKLYTKNNIYYLLEYSEESKTAFGYCESLKNNKTVGYIYLPNLGKESSIKVIGISKYIDEILTLDEKNTIKSFLKTR